MPILMTAEIPASADMYDALSKEMGMSNDNLPKGLIAHYAAPTDNGMLIFDVWESKDHFERFQNDRLMPAVMKVSGGEMPPGGPPEMTFAELHNEFHR